jgi:hypothetical protein
MHSKQCAMHNAHAVPPCKTKTKHRNLRAGVFILNSNGSYLDFQTVLEVSCRTPFATIMVGTRMSCHYHYLLTKLNLMITIS